MLDTAISSALVALVTAKNNSTSIAAAPPLPNKAAAAVGAGNPALTSAAERCFIAGSPDAVSATAERPIVVANMNGMLNHANPPRRYALTQLLGLAAMARCQYAWSLYT